MDIENRLFINKIINEGEENKKERERERRRGTFNLLIYQAFCYLLPLSLRGGGIKIDEKIKILLVRLSRWREAPTR